MTASFSQLLQTLNQHFGRDDLKFESEPVLLLGGFDAELVRFRLADAPKEISGDLVARIVGKPRVGSWEAAVQEAVAVAGFPTPAVRLTVDESSPLGRFLIVMDYIDGLPALGDLGSSSFLNLAKKQLRRVPDLLAQTAAQLHQLDPAPLAAKLASLSDPLPYSSADYLASLVQTARELGYPVVADAGERLLANPPPPSASVITHGDLHPLNLLVANGHTWLIDWSMGKVTDPGYTLGFTYLLLRHLPLEVPRLARPALIVVGQISAHRFLGSYRSLTKGTVAEVSEESFRWHRQLHAVRMLVEIMIRDATLANTEPIAPRHPFNNIAPAIARTLGISWP